MYLRVHVRNFAVECAVGGASEALRLVFVLLASNLEHDYLGLYVVLEASEDGGHGAARLAQLGPPVPSVVRQQVHEMLGSSVVQSLAVRARRPAGSRRYAGCKHGLAAQGVPVGRRPNDYHDARSRVDRTPQGKWCTTTADYVSRKHGKCTSPFAGK